MKDDKILRKLSVLSKKILEINDFDIGITMENTPQWDSLNHLQMISAIEKTFDIQLEFEDTIKMTSVRAILEILKNYLKKDNINPK